MEFSNAAPVKLGDCLGPDGLRRLRPGSVGHVIADPPFGSHVHANARVTPASTRRNGRRNPVRERALGYGHLTDDQRGIFLAQCARAVCGWTLAFCDVESVGAWKAAAEAAGLRWIRAIPWVKPNAQPNLHGWPGNALEMVACMYAPRGKVRWNGGGKARVYTFNVLDRGPSRLHPEQKPLELMSAIVEDFTRPGDLVVDPFAGSGSTLVAAALLGRQVAGWEIDRRHMSGANARIATAVNHSKREG